MTNGIFHITVATLVGAMTVAGVAIAMAPSRAGEVAKTAPIAAAIPVAPIAPPQTAPAPAPTTSSNPLLDGCVINAIGRLPKVDGLRVTKSWYERFAAGSRESDGAWRVYISVDLHGRQAPYHWVCLIINDETRLSGGSLVGAPVTGPDTTR